MLSNCVIILPTDKRGWASHFRDGNSARWFDTVRTYAGPPTDRSVRAARLLLGQGVEQGEDPLGAEGGQDLVLTRGHRGRGVQQVVAGGLDRTPASSMPWAGVTRDRNDRRGR